MAVGRTYDHQPRHGPQRHQMLHRLVGRPVLAEGDGVVGKDVDDLLLHQRAETQGRAQIVGENQERGCVWNGAAVDGDAVGDRAHSVLADAKVQVAAIEVAGADVSLAVENGQGGRGQVGGAADEVGNGVGDGVHHLPGRLPGGDGRRVIEQPGQTAAPAGREGAVEGILQSQGLGGEIFAVAGEGVVPLFLVYPAPVNRLGQMLPHLSGDGETFGVGPVELLAGEAHLVVSQRRAVDSGGACLVGAAVADDRAADDHGGAGILGAGVLDGRGNGVKVVAVQPPPVRAADYVPAVSLEPAGNILEEGDVGVAFNGNLIVIVQQNQLPQLQGTGQDAASAATPSCKSPSDTMA